MKLNANKVKGTPYVLLAPDFAFALRLAIFKTKLSKWKCTELPYFRDKVV